MYICTDASIKHANICVYLSPHGGLHQATSQFRADHTNICNSRSDLGTTSEVVFTNNSRPPGARHQRRPDNAVLRRLDSLSKAKSRFNIFLSILQSSYITIMFLRAIFSIFALQTIF